MAGNIIESVDGLKNELDGRRPLPPEVVARVAQKIRLELNYHSNAIEGNTLTLGETRNLILHGLTAHGKPMRDHLDIEGHDDAVKAIEGAVKNKELLNGVFIRNLHRILLKAPYEMDALTPDGKPTKRLISIGQYKTAPNNVRTTTGEIHYYTPPEQVNAEMSDLLDWYRAHEDDDEHPIIVAATFHYRFVRIHPFDDGNGRMARLLMNMILIRHGYTLAIIENENRNRYIKEIEDVAKTETFSRFIEFIASCCEYTLRLHLRAARGESIEDASDIDREIALFKRSVLGRARSDTSIEGRKYVEDTVYPLREYCKAKLEILASDVFVRATEQYSNVEGRASDGKVFSCSFGGLSDDIQSSVPINAMYMRTEFSFALPDSHGAGNAVSYDIKIENQYSVNGCSWTFKATRDWREEPCKREYEGHNLDELKSQFNDLLRWVMEDIARLVKAGARNTGAITSNLESEQDHAMENTVAGRKPFASMRRWIRRWIGRRTQVLRE